nr:tripartite motif-containing protein 55 isoform X6 [Oryctolagus cuniculus]
MESMDFRGTCWWKISLTSTSRSLPGQKRSLTSPCVRSTKRSASTSTVSTAKCPPAPCARCSAHTRIVRWLRSRTCSRGRSVFRITLSVKNASRTVDSLFTLMHSHTKSELSDGIAVLVGSNDRVQGVISQLEDTCKTIEECCRKQKQELCEKFDYLYGILEERKNEMTQVITRTQEEKLEHVRSLIKKYSDHLENVSKLVESGIQFMDEPEMAVFLQNAKTLLQKISEASKAFQMEKIEHGYENMNHFTVNLDREEKVIRDIDFYREDEDEEEEGEGEIEEGEEGGEEVLEVEEVGSIQIESSGEDESPGKGMVPLQSVSEVQATPEAALPVSSPEPPAALLPAVDAPATQGEVVPTGSQQTTESETPLPAAAATADPLLYPSWYKGQTRKAITNPPCTQGSEGLGQIGAPGSEDSNVQKAEVAGAAAIERAAVSGKETSSPAATSQELAICLVLLAFLILHYIWSQIQSLIFTLMDGHPFVLALFVEVPFP